MTTIISKAAVAAVRDATGEEITRFIELGFEVTSLAGVEEVAREIEKKLGWECYVIDEGE